MLLLLFVIVNRAATEIDGIYYNLDSNSETAAVTSGANKYSGDVTIPATVVFDGVDYSVTSIVGWAFYNCNELTSIVVPNSVTSIGTYAFYLCSSLVSVTLSDNLTIINQYTFRGCSKLAQIDIPYGVTSIGEDAFYDCSALTSIEIPSSVTSIGSYAFGDCQSLASVNIPNSVTNIGSGAFWNSAWYNNQPDGLVYAGMVAYKYKGTMPSNTVIELKQGTLGITGSAFSNCSGLASITIPNMVKNIGNNAFSGCTGLTAVNIPNSVNSIGDDAFSRCKALTSITIPGSVKTIGNNAFYSCSGLTSAVIYDGVISLGNFVFAYCSNLSSITIPNSVESIGSYAFQNTPWLNSQSEGIVYVGKVAYMYKGYMPSNTSVVLKEGTTTLQSNTFERCSGLVSITIPASLTNIGINAFKDCTSLTSIVVDGANGKYDSRENCNGIIETSTNSLIAGCKNTVIPNSVTSIGNNSFYNCSGLTSLTIPGSVTSIGSSAFGGCNGLASIVVDAGNSKYDSRENCNAIIESSTNCLLVGCKNTVIPNSVTSIGENVFYNCSGLTSISIPSGVESIGYCSFMDCSDLTDVYCYAEKLPTTEKGTFDGVGNTILHVPASMVETYRTTAPWSNFKEIVAIDETTTSITVLASPQTDEQDELFKKVYWDGENMVYPDGYENYDNKLTFLYAKESGIYSDYCTPTLAKASWSYPGELLSQLKSANPNNEFFAVGYEFIYDGDGFDFVDGRYRSLEDSILVQVSPADMELANAEISLLNSKGEDVVDAGFVELAGVKRYNEEGLWTIKFRLNNAKISDLLGDDADYLEDNYAVAVKGVDNDVISEYNLSLGLEEMKHAYNFNVNDVSVAQIHNRYICAEEIRWGEPLWTDDSLNYSDTFRYEMTWQPLACDNNDGDDISEIAFSSILGQNCSDRYGHYCLADQEQRETSGEDNRHTQQMLPVHFKCVIDGEEWAKIDIEFPTVNENGDFIPIRGFFVTLDNHFAIESQCSEINAWATYVYKNVAKYNYNHGVKQTEYLIEGPLDIFIEDPITLQPGNKGTIYIKNAHNLRFGDIIGFRVHAVNLDGTLTDPDGRAFYVKVNGNEKLTFNIQADTLESYAVSDCDMTLSPSDNYKVELSWRGNNPAIRAAGTGTEAYTPVAGTNGSLRVEDFFDFQLPTNGGATMRAAIKANVANRLIDGAIYKVTMSIQRQDDESMWTTVNTYDIDITKVMPTAMPAEFGVRTLQLDNGVWPFYLRPYAGVEYGETAADSPWKISWNDGDGQAPAEHDCRWGVDARPYDFKDLFTGLILPEEDKIDKNYYFVFKESGDFAAADVDATEASDEQYKDDDAIAVYTDDVDGGCYQLPKIHWSHVGESKNVEAGYIYRGISARLDETGKKFLNPQDVQVGLAIENQDYAIDPVPVMAGSKQLVASFSCALDAAVVMTDDETKNIFEYNEIVYCKATDAKFKLKNKNWCESGYSQAYFNTQFPATWTDVEGGVGTLTDLIAAPYFSVDMTSLKCNVTSPAGFNYRDYYCEPFFAKSDGTEANTFNEIADICMKPRGNSPGLVNLKTNIEGTFTFDIYDIWFHSRTVTVKFKIKRPTNTPEEGIPGDMDGDGILSEDDMQTIMKYIQGFPLDDFDESAADVNNDHVVNILDVVMIIEQLKAPEE